MTLDFLPRALERVLLGAALVAVLLALFSFEFSIPSQGVSGFAVSLVPRWGVVVCQSLPDDVLWVYHGDEWGGGLTHLRNLLLYDGLLMMGVLLSVSLATRRRALTTIVPLTAGLGCLVCLGLAGWGDRGWAGATGWAEARRATAAALLVLVVPWWAYWQRRRGTPRLPS